MYVPAHFAMAEADVAATLTGLRTADLITSGPDGLIATFLPLEYDAERHALLGHVARNNPHWRAAEAATGPSLVIARGPDAYISPSWYPGKTEHGRVVPTWNYTTVHVYGALRVSHDTEWLRGLVTRLTSRHEADSERPWAVTDAPAAFIDGQLRAIVGLELAITRIEAKAKLSQNRQPADRDGAISGLDGRGPDARMTAAAMRRAAEAESGGAG